MIGVKVTGGGFQAEVFESVIDTLAGGVTLKVADVSGTMFPDGEVPAGTLVSVPDVDGFSYPVQITNPGGSATFDKTPLGFTYGTVKVEDNTLVGVVIEGVVRKDAVTADVKSSAVPIVAAIPKITMV